MPMNSNAFAADLTPKPGVSAGQTDNTGGLADSVDTISQTFPTPCVAVKPADSTSKFVAPNTKHYEGVD